MDYEQRYNQLSNTHKGALNKYGEEVIQIIQETDTNYLKSNQIASKIGEEDVNVPQVGSALGALEEIYGRSFDYTSGRSTRGQWMIYKLQEVPLQELSEQVLEQ